LSQVTADTGQLPICPYCELKHVTDAKAHSEGSRKDRLTEIQRELGEVTGIDIPAYEGVREVEHKVEDYLTVLNADKTVLRSIRHKIEEGEREMSESESNPRLEACTFRHEEVKPSEAFDPASFRTLCPECPGARCSNCPPELACASRVIIGCPSGQFVAGRCQVGTETHVIYHGEPKA